MTRHHIFHVRGEGEGELLRGSQPTPKMQAKLRFGRWSGSKRKEGHQTPKTCHLGVFWVFNMRAGVGRTTNTLNMPQKCREVEHIEHTPKGVLDMFDMRVDEEHIEHAQHEGGGEGGVRKTLNMSNMPQRPCSM